MPAPAASEPIYTVVHCLDAEVSAAQDRELRHLLLASFPHEPVLLTRRYIHEAPAHRWLVRTAAGDLVAHTAVHDKVIFVGGRDLRIGGVAEVCVAHPYRGRGLVRRMLAEAHAWMQGEAIPFAMLFGQPKIYGSSGYAIIENPMVIQGSLIHQLNPFKGKPLVHAITATDPWPAGTVDLHGPTF